MYIYIYIYVYIYIYITLADDHGSNSIFVQLQTYERSI